MVSDALLDLFGHNKPPAPAPHNNISSAQVVHNGSAAGLFSELEWLGCSVALVQGAPVIRGNRAAITSDLLALLKENRAAIIAHLSEHQGEAAEGGTSVQPLSDASLRNDAGIRKDPDSGKLHLFGDPCPRWLKEQGWEWDARRCRFLAPYPHDREDPPPHYFVEARAVKHDHHLDADGPCSTCGFTNWWRKAGDHSEGWVCSVCHPAPDGTAIMTPQTLTTLMTLDATA